MAATLSASVRQAVLSALPPGAAGDDPTDEDLVRGLAASVGTLRHALVEVTSAREVAPPSREASPALSLDFLHKILAGDAAALEAPPDAASRRLVDEATALRRRADDAAAALAEARQALAIAEGRGSDRAREAFARALRHAMLQGRAPDDLPMGPLRTLAEEVAALRSTADTARTEAADAEKRAADAEKRAIERAKRSAETRREQGVSERQAKAVVEAAEKKVRDMQHERDGARRARELAEAEASHRIRLVEQAEREADEARTALELAAQTLGMPPGSPPDHVIARMAEVLGSPVSVAATPAPVKPLPPPEPPPMREADWRELKDGDLALDRKGLLHLRRIHDLAETEDAPQPTDAERRVLVLRVGDQVVWLRGDGVYTEGITAADAPSFRPGRPLYDARSAKALVIAEGLTGEPDEVLNAWHDWLRAAEAAPGLAVALDDSPASSEDE